MQDHHELFEIKRGDKRLSVAVLKTSRHRTYIGSINGRVCAVSFGKGDLLRRLIEIASGKQATRALVLEEPKLDVAG